MKIMMVSSQVSPFAKTGGLADAVSSLSIALSELKNEVYIVMPRYYCIDKKSLKLVIPNLMLRTETYEVYVAVYEGYLPESNVKVFFVDFEKCFGRSGIYGDHTGEYKDNPFRFSVLSVAAFNICSELGIVPDVMHSHDWPSSLVPVLHRYYFRDQEFNKTISVHTIHNLGYQGKFPMQAFKLLGINYNYLEESGFKQFEWINHLQAGIVSADRLTTVSPSYAQEILVEQNGFGLSSVLANRKEDLCGILNGVDYNIWNPETDVMIPANYSASDMSGKKICKAKLQERFGLEINENKPVIGFVARLVEQKGIDQLFRPNYGCLWNLCTQLDAQFIVVGSGDFWCEQEINVLQSKLPNLKCYIGYNEEICHLVESGADFFLMPSVYEPCGLNQMYSQIYGTIPIVHSVGGLKDSVRPFGKFDKPTGFGFLDLYPDAILNTIRLAVNMYYNNREIIENMRIEGMKTDFSWKKSAQQYLEVYKK